MNVRKELICENCGKTSQEVVIVCEEIGSCNTSSLVECQVFKCENCGNNGSISQNSFSRLITFRDCNCKVIVEKGKKEKYKIKNICNKHNEEDILSEIVDK
ncbi:MAG: hypothetical protein ACOCP8_00940 [archaeon]